MMENGYLQARCAPRSPTAGFAGSAGKWYPREDEKCHPTDGETEAQQSYANSLRLTHLWTTTRTNPAGLGVVPAVQHLSYPSPFKNLRYFTLVLQK